MPETVFDRRSLQQGWHPFTVPLQQAGLPRKTFRAPLLAKLQAAGFESLLDVRSPRALLLCHHPSASDLPSSLHLLVMCCPPCLPLCVLVADVSVLHGGLLRVRMTLRWRAADAIYAPL
jgi:hypothetical protein